MTLKKELTKNGVNGIFHGSIVIDLFYKTERKEVHNPSTHDEEMKNITYHRVRGFANEEQVGDDHVFVREEDVWMHIEVVEVKVSARLHDLATAPKKKTLLEELKLAGYFQTSELLH